MKYQTAILGLLIALQAVVAPAANATAFGTLSPEERRISEAEKAEYNRTLAQNQASSNKSLEAYRKYMEAMGTNYKLMHKFLTVELPSYYKSNIQRHKNELKARGPHASVMDYSKREESKYQLIFSSGNAVDKLNQFRSIYNLDPAAEGNPEYNQQIRMLQLAEAMYRYDTMGQAPAEVLVNELNKNWGLPYSKSDLEGIKNKTVSASLTQSKVAKNTVKFVFKNNSTSTIQQVNLPLAVVGRIWIVENKKPSGLTIHLYKKDADKTGNIYLRGPIKPNETVEFSLILPSTLTTGSIYFDQKVPTVHGAKYPAYLRPLNANTMTTVRF
ncbi:MAG: hypothetical protein ACRCXZ_09155 [Patescibacteria group bacterium]